MLLPGGHAVLFHAFGDTAGDRVAVLDLDTGEEKTVVEGGSNPAYVDTGHLVFARGDTLMAVPFKASELAVTGEPVALVQGIRRSAGGAADYALSANGTLAYVPGSAEAASSSAVVWVDRTGKVIGRAVPDLIANPRDPRLSPDGKRLLLVTGQDNDGDLWSYDLSGRPPIPLALPNDNHSPVWSPDGKQVAFLVRETSTVMVVAADGSERTPRPLRAQFAGAAGLVGRRGVDSDVREFASPTSSRPPRRRPGKSATSSPRTLSSSTPRSRRTAVGSPMSRTARGNNEIWVQAYPEGAPVRVSSNGGYEPLWSADGRELFYRQDAAVMAVAVETRQRVLVRGAEAPVLGSVRPIVQARLFVAMTSRATGGF